MQQIDTVASDLLHCKERTLASTGTDQECRERDPWAVSEALLSTHWPSYSIAAVNMGSRRRPWKPRTPREMTSEDPGGHFIMERLHVCLGVSVSRSKVKGLIPSWMSNRYRYNHLNDCWLASAYNPGITCLVQD